MREKRKTVRPEGLVCKAVSLGSSFLIFFYRSAVNYTASIDTNVLLNTTVTVVSFDQKYLLLCTRVS